MTEFVKFQTMVVNSNDIIQLYNLTENNYEEFYRNYMTYGISSCHKVELVADLIKKNTYTPVDCGLLKIIKHLNKLGYYTDWCCEGDYKKHGGYIAFTNGLSNRKITNKKALKLFNTVEKIKSILDIKIEYTSRLCIRWKPKSPEDKALILNILEREFLKLK